MDVLLINPAGYRGTPRRGPYELGAFRSQLCDAGLDAQLWDIQGDVGAGVIPFPVGHLEALNRRLLDLMARCYVITSRTTAGPWVVALARMIKTMNPSGQVVVYAPRIEPRVRATMARTDCIDGVIASASAGILDVVHTALGGPSAGDLDGVPARRVAGVSRVDSAFSVGEVWNSPDGSIAAIQVGRGCPERCTFCAAHLGEGGVPKYAPAAEIVNSAARAYRELDPAKRLFVMLETENLTSERSLLAEMVALRSSQALDFRWGAYGRVDQIDSSTERLLVDGGCAFLFFGLETAVSRLQKTLGKRFDVPRAIQTIKRLAKAGIRTQSSFMFGIPGETYEDFVATGRLMAKVTWAGGYVDWTVMRIEAGSAMERMVSGTSRRLLRESELCIDLVAAGVDPSDVDEDAGYRMYGLDILGCDTDTACRIARRWRTLLVTAPLTSYAICVGRGLLLEDIFSLLKNPKRSDGEVLVDLIEAEATSADFLGSLFSYEKSLNAGGAVLLTEGALALLYGDLLCEPRLLPSVFGLGWWVKKSAWEVEHVE